MMKRRNLILATAGSMGLWVPRIGMAATPCPPPQVTVGSSSANTSCGSSASSYSTNFPADENPLSEGGNFTSTDNDLTRVRSSGGICFGVTDYMRNYEDAYALKTGSWSANQEGEGVIHRASGYNPNANHEVEILLRGSETASSRAWYEILWNKDGDFAIVYLNGEAGDWSDLSAPFTQTVPKNGDVFKGNVIGNVITGYVNGVKKVQVSDSRLTSGRPGLAFFYRSGATNSGFGYSRYTCRNL
jgi:hypothetical protein